MKNLLMAVAAGACALASFADVIYVAPDGTGTGTSWEDAAPIKTAFAAAVKPAAARSGLRKGSIRRAAA